MTMSTTTAERIGSTDAAVMARLLTGFSMEIMPRDKKAIPALQENVAAGTEVFVAFAQGETPERVVETAEKLVQAGYRPTPHVVGRNLKSESQLKDYLTGLKQAGADRVLVLGGDADKPSGPFTSGLDVLKTGAVAAAGFKDVSIGGYPEEHPKASTEVLDRALQDKLAEAERQGLQPRIITQLCFEAAPIVAYAEKVRGWGV
jgi:methylenetetrahydrofolate reductase (NADPH)